IGRGSSEFVEDFVSSYPNLVTQLIATGGLPSDEAAAHLAACDVLVQPFIDGITCRRTSAMAGLALGVPTVSTRGPLTEPMWEESQSVIIADNEPIALANAIQRLVDEPTERQSLSLHGSEMYMREFNLGIIVARLRGSANTAELSEGRQWER